jgi:pyruvate/2-oxoglutarate dehydrogenase complex dihydrolipoamide dehydrogenase (E3) component
MNDVDISTGEGPTRYDVAIIGGGSGGERVALMLGGALNQAPVKRVVVFESALVGGECPYYACMPSKELLFEANRIPKSWDEAIKRKDEVTKHRNDEGHAHDLEAAGVTLVRGDAILVGPGRVQAGNATFEVEHVVIATGAAHRPLDVEGGEGLWTAADAMKSNELPDSLVIIGGGAIGCELSEVYAKFGTAVTIVESAETLIASVEPEVSAAMLDHLRSIGVEVRLGVGVERVCGTKGAYEVMLKQGIVLSSTHVLVAIGKAARVRGLGLESVGIDPNAFAIDEHGGVVGAKNLWAVGDVTGIAPYTHGANSQALAVAENILGGSREIRGPVIPRCIYTHPPLAAVGRSSAEFEEANIVVARKTFDDIARPTTDCLGAGLLTVIADRKTGVILGASGFGHSMDEVIGQLTMAMETQWPVQRLRLLVQPFPTISELVGAAYEELAKVLAEDEAQTKFEQLTK